ncbi:MAG: HNH nuclease [Planctomycetota bacterium]|nr:MAG: HNH nuclease [Planctomycetota bacterium]
MAKKGNAPKYPQEFLDKLAAITAKRAKTVIDHVLKHGHITTEELKETYGYNHPPRAIRDVREQGIPMEMYRTTDRQGRSIAAYRFGDPSEIKSGKLGGRKAFSKAFKQQLIDKYGAKCGICHTEYEPRYLQVDHRVPYEVAGDSEGELKVEAFMLVCGSCNRAKSWSCEHCENWKSQHLVNVCQTCYWANPTDYSHVALRLIRRLDVAWTGQQEVDEHDALRELSMLANQNLPDFVKDALRRLLNSDSS